MESHRLFFARKGYRMETVREKFEKFIYKDFEAYQELSDGDKKCFDELFMILMYQGSITWSNQKLSSYLNESESTLEKRLKRLEEAKLITREVSKQCFNGEWRTVDRIITLNQYHFDFDFQSMAHLIFTQYLFYKQTTPILEKYLELPYEQFKEVFKNVKVKVVRL